MKADKTFESALETAERITVEQLAFRNDENAGQWEPFNINDHMSKLKECTYLECVLENHSGNNIWEQLVGIFVVRLWAPLTFRIKSYEHYQVSNLKSFVEHDDTTI